MLQVSANCPRAACKLQMGTTLPPGSLFLGCKFLLAPWGLGVVGGGWGGQAPPCPPPSHPSSPRLAGVGQPAAASSLSHFPEGGGGVVGGCPPGPALFWGWGIRINFQISEIPGGREILHEIPPNLAVFGLGGPQTQLKNSGKMRASTPTPRAKIVGSPRITN